MQRLTKQEVRRRVEATMISVISLIETGLSDIRKMCSFQI